MIHVQRASSMSWVQTVQLGIHLLNTVTVCVWQIVSSWRLMRRFISLVRFCHKPSPWSDLVVVLPTYFQQQFTFISLHDYDFKRSVVELSKIPVDIGVNKKVTFFRTYLQCVMWVMDVLVHKSDKWSGKATKLISVTVHLTEGAFI